MLSFDQPNTGLADRERYASIKQGRNGWQNINRTSPKAQQLHRGAEVKVLLRDEATRLYWKADGHWVADPAGASAFDSLKAAGERARQGESLHPGLSVVLAYENPRCELALNPAYCI